MGPSSDFDVPSGMRSSSNSSLMYSWLFLKEGKKCESSWSMSQTWSETIPDNHLLNHPSGAKNYVNLTMACWTVKASRWTISETSPTNCDLTLACRLSKMVSVSCRRSILAATDFTRVSSSFSFGDAFVKYKCQQGHSDDTDFKGKGRIETPFREWISNNSSLKVLTNSKLLFETLQNGLVQ